ncbi:MAG: PQQ-binding-like beta-propeller repeat protein [Marinilabiliaceae bacterium]|nr:PQQ-binding-like beta-propeller repeat protein [Marinilabiliaceae bacterium]
MILIFCFAISCEAGETSGTSSGDWNFFRGNVALSGYSNNRLPDKPVLLWTFKSEARTSSSPIVYDGTVFWTDKRGMIRGVDNNGKLIFQYDLKTAVEATPLIYDSTLYIGRIDGFVTAISLSKRKIIWNYETYGQISATPNIADFDGKKGVVIGSYDNYLYCIDARNGNKINRFESGYYLNGAVAIQNNYALFGGCDAWLRIINCKTGIQTDSLLLDSYIPASPAIFANTCYIGDHSGNIYEIKFEKGKIVGHKKIMTANNDNSTFVSVPAVTEKNIYFILDDRNLYSVNRGDGTIKWKFLLKGNVGESSPVVCFDKIIVCTKTGIISIIDRDSGKLIWEYDTGEQIIGSPAVIKNRFFVISTKGTVFCFGKN